MTMAEKKLISIQKEVEKYEKSLATHKARLEKKNDKCIKLGCDWTKEEFREKQRIISERHAGEGIIPLGNDDDVMTEKQNGAYWDRLFEESSVEDAEHHLENAKKRLQRITREFEIESEKNAKEEAEQTRNRYVESCWSAYYSLTPEERRARYEKWLKNFKAECLKDGITIYEASNDYFNGTTKSGKYFCMYINEGWTERSYHCYTLRIDKQTIFTSGDFSTGYRYLKK